MYRVVKYFDGLTYALHGFNDGRMVWEAMFQANTREEVITMAKAAILEAESSDTVEES